MASLLTMRRGASSLRTIPIFEAHIFARPAPGSLMAQCRCYSTRPRPKTPSESPRMQWFSIPVSLGIAVVGGLHLYKTYKTARDSNSDSEHEDFQDQGKRPKKRPRVRPDGPWQVKVMSTLPLKAVSRVWGWFNGLTIPYYLRVPGFRLYAFIFGVNLDEVAEADLRTYPNLAAFFYRTLKPGARPLDARPNALLSPADGKVLQFGQIEGNDIEQVKGMTYTIDALLGKNTPTPSISSQESEGDRSETVEQTHSSEAEDMIQKDEEFAQLNGISYTLPNIFSGSPGIMSKEQPKDESISPDPPSKVSQLRAELALGEKQWYELISSEKKTALYYAVIYLAPGDYHRFHSPANWVVERRRHFAGELYSVSPYLQQTLPGLFTLNERVVLLGRWRWGFFSFVPVGATNVGSIKVNFDRELRTNSLVTDTAADRAAEQAAARGEPYLGFSEATYEGASAVLRGHGLRRGEEMGGFQLGSTVVLVFEAPARTAPSATPAAGDDQSQGGWSWEVEKGQKIKMGQALGHVAESS